MDLMILGTLNTYSCDTIMPTQCLWG